MAPRHTKLHATQPADGVVRPLRFAAAREVVLPGAPVRSSRVRGRRSPHHTPGRGAAYTRRRGEVTVFEAVGGMPFFEALVDRFYEGVAADPNLLAVYPEPDDLSGARHRLTLFLAQYWGGPDTYGRERGHPRLRMRHAPFAVGPDARDRWL